MNCQIARRLTFIISTVVASFVLNIVACSHAFAQYTAGNLVVSGVDTTGTANASGAVTLYQYTASGTSVNSQTLTSITGTGNNPLTISNSAASEGALTLSTGGDFLSIQGYNAAAGTASIASTATTAAPREVGIIGANGNVNTSTTLGTAYSGGNVRSSVYDDASLLGSSKIYTGGTASSSANGYVRSTTLGSTTLPTQSEATTSNIRDINIFNNANNNPTLYYSTGSATAGIYQLNSSPSATATATLIAASPNAYDFVFTNASTLYVADSTNGLEKYTLNGATFALQYTSNGTSGTTITGLTGLTYNSATSTFYGVTPNSLISFVDNSLTSTFTQTTLATAATGTAFRGVDFAPATATTPAPPGIVSAGIGFAVTGLGALLRRRKQSQVPGTATPEAAA